MKALFWMKVKTVAGLAGLAVALGAGGSLALRRLAAGEPDQGRPAASVNEKKVERKGPLAKDVATKLGVTNGMEVRITQDGHSVTLTAAVDAGLAAGCVRVPAAMPETAALGPMSGSITVEKAAIAAAAE